MSETHTIENPPLANSPEARTETGELKNQIPQNTDTQAKSEPEKKPEAEPEKKEGETLLNEGKKKEEAQGAPEKYEPFTLPEGVQVDEATMTEAQAIFKESGLTQGAAQKFVDFYTKQLSSAVEKALEPGFNLRDQWRNEVKADKEIGGRLDEVKQTIGRALNSLNDPVLADGFRKAMDITGAGDNPAFIKAFFKLAQRVGEGRQVIPGGASSEGQRAPGTGPRSAASAMFPNLPSAG